MSLQYIIDAYNLINHPDFHPTRQAENIQLTLVNFIRTHRLAGSKNNQIILVFDGYPAANYQIPEEDNLTCIFSHNLEADELIKRWVERSVNPKTVVVVSDDKQVRMMAQILHAEVCAVDEFIGVKHCKSHGALGQSTPEEAKLNYSQMHKINDELRKKWLEK